MTKKCPLPPPQLCGSLAAVRFPAFAEVKIDGEFDFFIYEKSIGFTINKYGNTRQGYSMTDELRSILKTNQVTSAMMLGEVYYGDGKSGALYDFLRHKKSDDLKIKLFDIVTLNNKDMRRLPLIDRKEALLSLSGMKKSLITPRLVHNKAEAMEYFHEITKQGFEGIVVKGLDSPFISGPCSWVKIKYKDQSDYVVWLIDKNKERIEILTPKDNKMIPVGVKVSNKDKAMLSVGEKVTIEHQGVLKSGSLRHPVYKGRCTNASTK